MGVRQGPSFGLYRKRPFKNLDYRGGVILSGEGGVILVGGGGHFLTSEFGMFSEHISVKLRNRKCG